MVKSSDSITAKFNTDTAFSEAADVQSPEVPIRSWAYHLEPIGIGTPNTESLTSYFIRLAEAHFVTPRAFFRHGMSKAYGAASQKITSYTDGLISPSDGMATKQINGSGVSAEKWVSSLEGVTKQNKLHFLTFLPWKSILSNRTMHRRRRAWCPACLEDQRLSGIPIYEQLRWTHKIVLMCSDHELLLETECPHCKNISAVLCGRSRPGLCPQCHGWLGYYPKNVRLTLKEHDTVNAAYEAFVAEQIGGLVTAAPNLAYSPIQETVEISITKSVELFFDGNISAFIRFFGMKKGVGCCFAKHETRYINLELLLRIAFRVGISLLNLLTNENALTDFNPLASASKAGKRLSPRRRKEDVRIILLAAVEERPAPSLDEITERLGYRQAHTLYGYFPEICDQIKANHLTYSLDERRVRWSTTNRQSNETILETLKSALLEERPPSLRDVARSLGYSNSQILRSRFPVLCKTLVEKRLNVVSPRRAMIEDELKRAIEGNIPISLDAISKKLGYKTTAMLRTLFPYECREIRRRYAEHNRNQFLSKLEIGLQFILIEVPPPSLNTSLRLIGASDGFLRKHFPTQRRAIAARYVEFRRQQSIKEKEIERKKIRVMVSDLIEGKIFPSMNIVLEHLPNIHLKYPEVWSTILQAREEFAHKA